MKYKSIQVLAAYSADQVEDSQCVEVRECDTVKEAKDHAKYCLTEAWQRNAETSEPLGYARVVADGEIVAEYSR